MKCVSDYKCLRGSYEFKGLSLIITVWSSARFNTN